MDAATAGRQQNQVGTTVTLYPPTRRLYGEAWPTIRNRSFVISAQVTADSGKSDGVLVAIGTSFNGYSFYLREGHLTFAHNMCGLEITHIRAGQHLPAGDHVVAYHFDYDGGGLARGGTGRLFIDGAEAGTGRVQRTAVFAGGRLTIGANPGTPVTPEYAGRGEYPYTGRIQSVTITALPDGAEPSKRQLMEAEMVIH